MLRRQPGALQLAVGCKDTGRGGGCQQFSRHLGKREGPEYSGVKLHTLRQQRGALQLAASSFYHVGSARKLCSRGRLCSWRHDV